MPVASPEMRRAARRGLAMRRLQAPSQRGGTAVGIARARDLVQGRNLSLDTVQRILNFLLRHKRNYKPGTQTPGTQAYLLWGGPSGIAWSRRVLRAANKD